MWTCLSAYLMPHTSWLTSSDEYIRYHTALLHAQINVLHSGYKLMLISTLLSSDILH